MERREALLSLKEEIKKNAAEGRAFNTKIRAAKGIERYHLRREKAQVGYMARYLLLAYALLRYRSYKQQEPHVYPDCKPWVTLLFDTANRFGNTYPKSVIESWLEGTELPIMTQLIETVTEAVAVI